MKPQRLCFRAVEFTPAAAEDSDGRTLEGYAAVFDTPTRIASWEGTFDETVKRGAFAKTLSERKPVLQFDHGRDARTGSVPIGKLEEAREDDKGLFIRARLFDNPTVEPIRQAIEGGAIDGMSFRFRVNQDDWFDSEGERVRDSDLKSLLFDSGDRGPLRREIREVELYEAGPVVFPAYEATSVGVRSMLAELSPEERETLLDELISRAASSKKKPPADEDDEKKKPADGKKKPPADEDDEEDPKGKKKPPFGKDGEKPSKDEDEDEDEGKKKAPPKKKRSGMLPDERARMLDIL